MFEFPSEESAWTLDALPFGAHPSSMAAEGTEELQGSYRKKTLSYRPPLLKLECQSAEHQPGVLLILQVRVGA